MKLSHFLEIHPHSLLKKTHLFTLKSNYKKIISPSEKIKMLSLSSLIILFIKKLMTLDFGDFFLKLKLREKFKLLNLL